MRETSARPVTNVVEEVTFNLAALASRDFPIVDFKDWTMAAQAQYTDAVKSGWPMLDIMVRPPNGSVSLIVRLGINTTDFFDWLVVGVAAGTIGEIRERIPTRFARLRVTDTSNAVNNDIYGWVRVASQ